MTSDPQAKAIEDELNALMGQAAGALILAMTANLIEMCPVRTGHARANFVPSVGDYEGTDSGAAQAAGIASVAGYKLGDGPLTITNNVPYIERLIGGSSAQAAAGWDVVAIEQWVQETQAQFDALTIAVGEGNMVTIAPRIPSV